MRSALAALLLLAATGAALAAPSQLDGWFKDLARAESPEEAKPLEDKIEGAFRQSGSASVDLLMSRVKEAMNASDNKTAAALLTAVTRLAPDYAEGWHMRATLEAADGNDTAAMLSLQKVVQLNPRNFTAMMELAGMLEDYGDKAGALKLYRAALALDPQIEGAARHIQGLAKDVEGQGI
jgi:tetratricopeptide (TPR) repeat protein